MKTNETKLLSVKELTPAELELITLKRREEELAAEKKALQIKADMEKNIAAKKQEMVKDVKSYAALNKAAEELLLTLRKLDKEYVLTETPVVKEYKCYNWLSKEERNAKGVESDEGVYFLETQELIQKTITHPSTKSKITPIHYSVDKGSTWHSRMEYQGIRFKLDLPGDYSAKNRALKSAATIHDKIDTKFQAEKNKAEAAQRKKTGVEWLLNILTAMYPTAAIKENQYSGSFYGCGGEYREGAKYVEVKFANNFELHYSFNSIPAIEKDEQSRMEVQLLKIVTSTLSVKDQQKIIDMFAK